MCRKSAHHKQGGDKKRDIGNKNANHTLGYMIAHKIADQARAQILRCQRKNHHRDRQGQGKHGDKGGQQHPDHAFNIIDVGKKRPDRGQYPFKGQVDQLHDTG